MKPSSPAHSRTSSVASILMRTQGFFGRQFWVWPLVAAMLLMCLGLWLRQKMEGVAKQQVAGMLQVVLNANIEALRSWSVTVRTAAANLAEDDRVRGRVFGLIQLTKTNADAKTALLVAPEQTALRAQLKPQLLRSGFDGFVVLDTNFLVLAAASDQLVGLQNPAGYGEFLQRGLAGETFVTRPFPSLALLADEEGKLRAGVPTMFAVAPVRTSDGTVVALVGLRIMPDQDFTRILTTARAGQTGETYAFDRQGRQLSESRFDADLKRLGLIPDDPSARSILTLELRDPLVDLTAGSQSPIGRSSLPLTYTVNSALAGRPGMDADGYRGYLGKPVVGAWTWDKDFDMGIVTEMGQAEALRPLLILRVGFWSLFGLLIAGAVLVYVLMRLASRFQEAARKAALKAKRLGQYALDKKIGEGQFGSVYKAHHALMRRPVAVKLLQAERLNSDHSARFEREVQLTSQLTHPNTITIYDYGRTPEGVFYYAMEYLEGLTLDRLVKQFGPQPEGRVIAILRQACGSLAEAHGIGLVHRDIKPANIFLTQRGGLADFVKVLDFGLVKARNTGAELELTMARATLGTPLYMSPEAVERSSEIDGRSDLYSLGAVGYFLLTGKPLFDSETLSEVLLHQLKDLPILPAERLGKPVSRDLAELLMHCLAKNPAARPNTARDLDDALGSCVRSGEWTRELADAWWRKYAAIQTEKTMVMQLPPATDAPDSAEAQTS